MAPISWILYNLRGFIRQGLATQQGHDTCAELEEGESQSQRRADAIFFADGHEPHLVGSLDSRLATGLGSDRSR